jgi:biopolymer transport protein ExbD
MGFFAEAPVKLHAAVLVLLLSAVLCLAGIVILRFLRRGAARFGIGPAASLLALVPAVLAAGVTTWAFHDTLSAIALVGSGGVAALAAGSAEALVPLALGLVCTALLAAAAVLVTAAGSSRVDPAQRGGGWWLPLVSSAVAALVGTVAAVAALMVGTVNTGLRHPGAIQSLWWLAVAGSGTLLLLLVVLMPVAAWRAPRGASSLGVRFASLLAPLVVAAGASAMAVGVYLQIDGLVAAALTGQPYRGALSVMARDALVGLGAEEDPGSVRIRVTRQAAYSVERDPVAREALKPRLADLAGRGKRLCVQAAGIGPYENVAPVVDAASEGGWTDLGLLTDETEATPCARASAVRMPAAIRIAGAKDGMSNPLFIVFNERALEINRNPVTDTDELHLRLSDILAVRRSKAVLLVVLPETSYGRVLNVIDAVRGPGADPVVLMTEDALERHLPPPPPPPPPPPSY